MSKFKTRKIVIINFVLILILLAILYLNIIQSIVINNEISDLFSQLENYIDINFFSKLAAVVNVITIIILYPNLLIVILNFQNIKASFQKVLLLFLLYFIVISIGIYIVREFKSEISLLSLRSVCNLIFSFLLLVLIRNNYMKIRVSLSFMFLMSLDLVVVYLLLGQLQ